jgi:hypothetical protein
MTRRSPAKVKRSDIFPGSSFRSDVARRPFLCRDRAVVGPDGEFTPRGAEARGLAAADDIELAKGRSVRDPRMTVLMSDRSCASVKEEDAAGGIARLVRGEIDHERGNLVRLAWSSKRNPLDAPSRFVLILQN